MDVHDKKTRSYNMSKIKSKNTRPEILIRKYLFSKGFRFRINDRRYPGTPDIVLKKYNAVIFIHGCFWHGHIGCDKFKIPKTNTAFWVERIDKNRKRDAEVLNYLHATGWRICIIWECAIRGKSQLMKLDKIINKISKWLNSKRIWIEITSEEY